MFHLTLYHWRYTPLSSPHAENVYTHRNCNIFNSDEKHILLFVNCVTLSWNKLFTRRKCIYITDSSHKVCQINLRMSTWNYRFRIVCFQSYGTLWNINGCLKVVKEHSIGQSSSEAMTLERPSCAAEAGTFLGFLHTKFTKMDVQNLKITGQHVF